MGIQLGAISADIQDIRGGRIRIGRTKPLFAEILS